MRHIILLGGEFHLSLLSRLFSAFSDEDELVIVRGDLSENVAARFEMKELPDILFAKACLKQEIFLGEYDDVRNGIYKNPFSKPCSTPPMKHFMYGSTFLN